MWMVDAANEVYASVVCLGMFKFLFWYGDVRGRPRWRVFLSRFWVLVGRRRDTVGMGEVCGGAL